MVEKSDTFAALLFAISKTNSNDRLEADNQTLMESFLKFSSPTPSNINCVEHIEYGLSGGREDGPTAIYGLKLKNRNILVADILNTVEGLPVPDLIRKYYPDLTQAEWDAAMRIAVITLIAFENPIKAKGD